MVSKRIRPIPITVSVDTKVAPGRDPKVEPVERLRDGVSARDEGEVARPRPGSLRHVQRVDVALGALAERKEMLKSLLKGKLGLPFKLKVFFSLQLPL